MKFTDLINEIVPEADGVVPNPVLRRCIREAVISFCRATWVWRHKDTVTIVAGESVAALTMPDDQTVACAVVYWEADRPCSKPSVISGTEISIEESAESPIEFDLTLALQPTNSATEYPDWMDGLYRQAIVAHAKHSILMQGNAVTPWRVNRAQILYGQYTDAVNSVRRELNPRYVRGNLQIRARR